MLRLPLLAVMLFVMEMAAVMRMAGRMVIKVVCRNLVVACVGRFWDLEPAGWVQTREIFSFQE